MCSGRFGPSRRRSCSSEVITACPRVRAHSTTDASITSRVPAAPHRCPAARARWSSSGSTSTQRAPSRLTSGTCIGPMRQTWTTTSAGTAIDRRSCTTRRMTVATRRSFRLNAISAPLSRVRPFARVPAPASWRCPGCDLLPASPRRWLSRRSARASPPAFGDPREDSCSSPRMSPGRRPCLGPGPGVRCSFSIPAGGRIRSVLIASAAVTSPAADIIIVLGARVYSDGTLSPALHRRVARAADAWRGGMAPRILCTGGKRWGSHQEAIAMRAELLRHGVDDQAVVLELFAHSTAENALYCARTLRLLGLRRAALVTCPWHMPRAMRDFVRCGVEVIPLPSAAGPSSLPAAIWRTGSERLSAIVDRVRLRLRLGTA